jgi:hypothetical protein
MGANSLYQRDAGACAGSGSGQLLSLLEFVELPGGSAFKGVRQQSTVILNYNTISSVKHFFEFIFKVFVIFIYLLHKQLFTSRSEAKIEWRPGWGVAENVGHYPTIHNGLQQVS